MEKIVMKPATMIYPLPAVMVSCGSHPDEYNIITVAWTGTICSDPPMCYISIRPSRHSYDIIKRNREFVINLTTEKLARTTDWCGIRSGRDYNKFDEMNLKPVKSNRVQAPGIAESPVNIECRVTDIIELGIHHMFMAEVLSIQADTNCFTTDIGSFELSKANLISYQNGKYFKTGEMIGKYGYSAKEEKTRNKPQQKPDGANSKK
jgi:flavin reductase (DIM6/NTAB) family NADH-FMN oxidoreductase RutF